MRDCQMQNTRGNTHCIKAEGLSKAKLGGRGRTCEGAIHRWLTGDRVKASGA